MKFFYANDVDLPKLHIEVKKSGVGRKKIVKLLENFSLQYYHVQQTKDDGAVECCSH